MGHNPLRHASQESDGGHCCAGQPRPPNVHAPPFETKENAGTVEPPYTDIL